MNILLTNDDGIHAPGILALYDELSLKHKVMVAAPEYEQSAVGHAITLADPIKVKEVERNGDFLGFAIGGTPADCVKIALAELFNEKPDLVISGINLGANVGINLLYSGTVSAATEAAILGYPAIAISLDTFENADFSVAAEFAGTLAGKMESLKIPDHVSLNVNVPAMEKSLIKGVAWCRQCQTGFKEKFLKRQDPRGNIYYWQGGEKPPRGIEHENDWGNLEQNMITITPIKYDLTHYEELARLSEVDLKF